MGNEEYIETINIDESCGLKQSENQQIVCITGDDSNYRQIEIEEYNEDQLEDECMDGSTSYERLPTSNQKQQKNENVYILSGTGHGSISSQDDGAQPTMRHTKIHNTQANHNQNDPDERFLLSCLPILKRLPNKKNALARLKIQQLLFDIEFEGDANN